MATIRIYRTGSPSERMSADDAGYETLIRELFADAAIWEIDGRAASGEQYQLKRLPDGRIEEARWAAQAEHYVCEECGHKQTARFTTCPQCGTQELIEKRAAGWQFRTLESL